MNKNFYVESQKIDNSMYYRVPKLKRTLCFQIHTSLICNRNNINEYISIHKCTNEKQWKVKERLGTLDNIFINMPNPYISNEEVSNQLYDFICDHIYKTLIINNKSVFNEDNDKAVIVFDMPKSCVKCPLYQQIPYNIHNESGMYSHCGMGYMNNLDTRDKTFKNSRYIGCKLQTLSNFKQGLLKLGN